MRREGSELRQPRGRKDPGLVPMEISPTHFSPNFIPCTPNIELLEIKGRHGKVPALGCLMYWGSRTSKPKGVTPRGVGKEWVRTRCST